MDKDQKKIMLLLTEECNLNCLYCYEHFKNKKKMSWETAKEIIDSFYGEIPPGETALIEVFGGEPFANFALLKKIDSYIEDVYGDRNTYFETTTNGTLVHGPVQEWLQERKEKYIVSLSLDGTEAMHNLNRPLLSGDGSYRHIDKDFFLRTWPGKCQAKLTLSKATLPHLAEGVIHLHKLGFVADATLPTGIEWNFEEVGEILNGELEKLVKFYTDNPSLDLCTLLNFDLRLWFAHLKNKHRFCAAGELTKCFDTEGNIFPCQGFAPVSLGDESSKFQNYDCSKLDLTSNNPCVGCRFFFLCPNCYTANLATSGCTHLVNLGLCLSYRECILASAKIQFNRLKLKKVFSENDRLVLKAIEEIAGTIESTDSPLKGICSHVCDRDNSCC
ncbi:MULTISPECIES: radical SAM protein [Erysipelotrichaceae]|nr:MULTISPECIES: radical SAM protein [Erysipelotrichaceae]